MEEQYCLPYGGLVLLPVCSGQDALSIAINSREREQEGATDCTSTQDAQASSPSEVERHVRAIEPDQMPPNSDSRLPSPVALSASVTILGGCSSNSSSPLETGAFAIVLRCAK